MTETILFVGGEQDGAFNRVSKKVSEVKLDIYPKLDLRKLTGIIRELPKSLGVEIYHRKRISDVEYFILEGLNDDEILAMLRK